MTLGRKDFSVTRTDGGADVFRLTGLLRDDDLISHDGSFGRIDSRADMRTYSERNGLASCSDPTTSPAYESGGRRFESFRARQNLAPIQALDKTLREAPGKHRTVH